MKLPLTYIFIVVIIMFSCSASKHVTDEQKRAMEMLLESRQFKIESNWAYPQITNAVQQVMNSGLLQPGSNSSGINLIGNINFLKLSNDSISSYLPFFGERTMLAGYGSNDDGVIKLEGVIKNYKSTHNKDGSYSINFDAKDGIEGYNVFIRVFPNQKTDLLLNGSFRLPIRYSGVIKTVAE